MHRSPSTKVAFSLPDHCHRRTTMEAALSLRLGRRSVLPLYGLLQNQGWASAVLKMGRLWVQG